MKAIFGLISIMFLGLSTNGQINLIPEDAKFSPDARVEFTKDPILEYRKANNLSLFEPKAYSTGTTNGVPYLFYFTDGSGQIGGTKGNGIDTVVDSRNTRNWTLRCGRTLKNNDKQCAVVKGELMVLYYLFKDGKSLLWIAILNTPDGGGLPVTITVDNGPGYTLTREGVQFPRVVVDEMKTGIKVTVRQCQGPDGRDVVHIYDLYGFKEALALSEWAVKQID